MTASKNQQKKIQWEASPISAELNQVFPISPIQDNNLNIIFGRAENLCRVAPGFFQSVMSMLPKSIKVAEVNPAIQTLIDKGVYKFLTDKNGEILPTIFGEKNIVAQVRLKDITLTPDLGHSIVDLQTQIALAQVISEIHDVQRGIEKLHNELQDDRLALAESAYQQMEQAVQIKDSRVREEKLLGILSSATDAKCILFRAFTSEKRFFDERKDKSWLLKVFDAEAQNHGDDHSVEIFTSLLALTKTVQLETTVYCLLGEQNAARTSLKQFGEFIRSNSLDYRETLLTLNSYSNMDQKSIIENFIEIQQKITNLPLVIEGTKPLIDTLPAKLEINNE